MKAMRIRQPARRARDQRDRPHGTSHGAGHGPRHHRAVARERRAALAEDVLAALHAGRQPPLSRYLARYPGAAGELLAAFVSLPDAWANAPRDESDDAARLSRRGVLSPGMRAALASLFPGDRPGDRLAEGDGARSDVRVAEAPGAYTTTEDGQP